MKRFAALLLLGLVLAMPGHASAHVLKTDGEIGSIMHISPDDDPVAGQQSTFFFDTKDKAGLFDVNNCDCQFMVSQDGKQLASQPMDNGTTATYTFPSIGVYGITFSGKPEGQASFQAFNIKYTVRVDRSANGTAAVSGQRKSPAGMIMILAIGLLIVGGFAALLFYSLRPKKPAQKP